MRTLLLSQNGTTSSFSEIHEAISEAAYLSTQVYIIHETKKGVEHYSMEKGEMNFIYNGTYEYTKLTEAMNKSAWYIPEKE